MMKRTFSLLLVALMIFGLLPTGARALEADFVVGNSDLNIQNGGVMLAAGEDFYFVHEGVFLQRGERVIALSADQARNLNLYRGYLYYTVGAVLLRIPAEGGSAERVFEAESSIDRLYVVNGDFVYLSGGLAFARKPGEQAARQLPAPSGVRNLIPTPQGNLYLTGAVFDYTLWAGERQLLSGVNSCYIDSDYLAVQKAGKNYMISLHTLFNGFDPATDLENFNIHGKVSMLELFTSADENAISEDNENNELQLDFAALLNEVGLTPNVSAVSLMTMEPGAVPTLSEGQRNIVKRARQLTEIEWTPLENLTQWGERGTFKAETTYKGIPYGQPVNTNGYVGYGVSIEGFAAAARDNSSKLHTNYSMYNKIAPSYSTDCSGYVSYAWELKQRKTTYSISEVSEKVGDKSLYSLQVGDALNDISSHVVLISDLTYDASGAVVGLEVMEQTPVITQVTRYGQGASRTLASFQSYYFGRGYEIYRNPSRDAVTYTPNPAVPLDGEIVPGQKERAPKTKTTGIVGGKTVALEASGAAIYYTLDGSMPTSNSTKYTAPITVNKTTKLRAIAVSGRFQESEILEYNVKLPPAKTPTASPVSGTVLGDLAAAGSQIKLESTSGAKIYYTTDGTEPTTESRIYTTPITINQNTTIRAFAESLGVSRSEMATLSYRLAQTFTITASAGAGGSISPSGTKLVLQTTSQAYTIIPATGFIVKDVLVNGSSVGAVTSYSFSNINANNSITASFTSSATLPFTDVKQSDWFYDAVGFVYAKTLFNGVSENSFAPEITMSRGMFATVLGRFSGLSSGLKSGLGLVTGTGVNIRKDPTIESEKVGYITNRNTAVQVLGKSGDWFEVSYGTVTGYIRNDLIRVYQNNYTDLKPNEYYSPYVEWSFLSGVATGVASGSFLPDKDISREEMCLMLYQYAQYAGKTLPTKVEKKSFTDDGAISQNAKAAVYALQQAGVIDGMGDGSFSPKSTATRAQVAKIFMTYSNAAQ